MKNLFLIGGGGVFGASRVSQFQFCSYKGVMVFFLYHPIFSWHNILPAPYGAMLKWVWDQVGDPWGGGGGFIDTQEEAEDS